VAAKKSKLLLYCYARFLFTIGDLLAALTVLEQCREIDSTYAPARETEENIKGLIVDR
jgi:hypothetical protein